MDRTGVAFMKYTQATDGEWINPIASGYRMACCDCGLVHDVEFAIMPVEDGFKVVYRASRNKRATAAKRRMNKVRDGSP